MGKLLRLSDATTLMAWQNRLPPQHEKSWLAWSSGSRFIMPIMDSASFGSKLGRIGIW